MSLQRKTPIRRKAAKPRRTTTPRCSRQRCNKPARIEGMCVTHAEREADRLFSLWVRARDGGCTFPELLKERPCNGPLQAAHGEPRGNHATRYLAMNCHSLCRDHHMLVDAGSKHALKAWWLIYVIGQGPYADLLNTAMQPADKRRSIEEALSWLR